MMSGKGHDQNLLSIGQLAESTFDSNLEVSVTALSETLKEG